MQPRQPLQRTLSKWLLFLVFASILIIQVFVSPPIGMANNGDFSKVAAAFNLSAPTDDEFQFFTRLWHFDPASHWWSEFVTTEHALAAVAIGVNKISRHDGWFDMRIIGAVHALLYLLAFYLLLPLLDEFPLWMGIAFGLVVITIFAGPMYAELMNTFYMDTPALLFLALAIVLYARAIAWGGMLDRTGFIIAAMLFAASKAQHASAALVLIPLVIFGVHWSAGWRVAGATLILAGAAMSWYFTQRDYRVGQVYDVIFLEILKKSASPERDLGELGLDSSYGKLIGTYSYEPASPMGQPEFVREFASRTSHGRILRFYLHHPFRGMRALIDGLDEAGKQRPPMGDYERATGREARTQAQIFGQWSAMKEAVFHEHGSLYLAYIIVLCAIEIALAWRTRYRLGAICLVGMTMAAMLVATLGDTLEVTRHCLLLNALVDFVFAACFAGGMRYWAGARENGISI